MEGNLHTIKEAKGFQEIVISYDLGDIASDKPYVYVDGRQLSYSEIEELAVNDGFDSAEDFFKWFKKDFRGWIIHWTDKKY